MQEGDDCTCPSRIKCKIKRCILALQHSSSSPFMWARCMTIYVHLPHPQSLMSSVTLFHPLFVALPLPLLSCTSIPIALLSTTSFPGPSLRFSPLSLSAWFFHVLHCQDVYLLRTVALVIKTLSNPFIVCLILSCLTLSRCVPPSHCCPCD